MKTIMARNLHDNFSLSTRYFNWKLKNIVEDDHHQDNINDDHMQENLTSKSQQKIKNFPMQPNSNSTGPSKPSIRKKFSVLAVTKLRSGLNRAWARTSSISGPGLSPKVVGTLFGTRRGHVHFAIQDEFNLGPALLVELATPTSVLVKEMASGLVRIALECDKRAEKKGLIKLLEEPVWRTYCNGKKCGFAMRRECGPEEWKVLNAIGPISMGAGVLPGLPGAVSGGEMMYMRAKFERVVGSKDSEAFYMMNPDGNGGPELSIYLLRI